MTSSDPTPEEAGELARIRDAVSSDEAAGAGLLLAGHRPNTTTTAWLAAAHRGIPGGCAPGGVYVCASLKEEFGIAILEAMAMGLVVVAPNGGGPATYIEDGVTGVLTDTSRPAGPGRREWPGPSTSPQSAGDPLRSRRSRAVVRERFGIDTMASSLGAVYARVASRHAEQSLSRQPPHDAARHQPGLRLAPLPPGHAGHRLAGRGRAGRRRDRPGHRRGGPSVRLRARAPAARPGVEPGRHPRRGAAAGRGRRAARLLRCHPPGRRGRAGVPGARPRRRPALERGRRGAGRSTPSSTACAPTRCSSTTSPSGPGWGW